MNAVELTGAVCVLTFRICEGTGASSFSIDIKQTKFEVQDANPTDPEELRQKSEVALTAGPLSGSRSEGAMGTEPHFHPADINLIQ